MEMDDAEASGEAKHPAQAAHSADVMVH
jgi:hypothetical protein